MGCLFLNFVPTGSSTDSLFQLKSYLPSASSHAGPIPALPALPWQCPNCITTSLNLLLPPSRGQEQSRKSLRCLPCYMLQNITWPCQTSPKDVPEEELSRIPIFRVSELRLHGHGDRCSIESSLRRQLWAEAPRATITTLQSLTYQPRLRSCGRLFPPVYTPYFAVGSCGRRDRSSSRIRGLVLLVVVFGPTR